MDTIASLELHLKEARAAESEAKQRFTELQEQLEKSTVSEDSDKIKKLEKELEALRTQEKELTDTISRLESTEKELIKCKKQLEVSAKEVAERDNELKTTKIELSKAQGSEGELKKQVAVLEEALSKANNDLGKSQVCIQQVILLCFRNREFVSKKHQRKFGKCCGNSTPRQVFPQLFLVLANFQEYFYLNSRVFPSRN